MLSSVEKCARKGNGKDSNQTKSRLFIIRGVFLHKHLQVANQAALTMPLYSKLPVFHSHTHRLSQAFFFFFYQFLYLLTPLSELLISIMRPLNTWFAWRRGQSSGSRFYFLCNLQNVTFRCSEEENHDDKVAGGEKGGCAGISLLPHMAFFLFIYLFILPSIKAKDCSEELECFVYTECTWQQTKEAVPVLLKS